MLQSMELGEVGEDWTAPKYDTVPNRTQAALLAAGRSD